MAQVKLFRPFNIDSVRVEDGDITVANSRLIRQDDGFERTDYRGSFNVSGSQSDPNISGTLREIDYFRGGAQILEVTNFARDAGRVADLIGAENTSGFLNFLFSSGDRFSGSAGNDRLRSFGGNDTVLGNGGDDTLFGGGGADTVAGGAGRDRLSGDGGADRLVGGAGGDFLFGGGGNDALFGGDANDQLSGGAGVDRLSGGGGADRLFGGGFGDRLSGDAGADLVAGGGGADTMFGGAGRDVMKGGDGSDRLFGGGDIDRLEGGRGNDILNGNFGFDVYVGGGGSDRFVFRQNEGNGRIVDFTHGQDKIVIGSGADSFDDLSFQFVNGDVRISFSNVTIVVDTDFTGRFDAGDFIF